MVYGLLTRISRGDRHGPPLLRRISALLSGRLTTWQTVVVTLLWLYVARNFDRLLDLECPEPLANLYTRSYFRATWFTTALDAGFWSAMRIRRKWLREFLSMVFSVYYLLSAEQADQKVRKVRATLTVEHLRVSWNKGTTPYLAFIARTLRPRFIRYPPRALRIPRPPESSYKEPVLAWLYFNGPLADLKGHNKIVLDIPGGGFVAMDPRKHDDKLFAWAGKTGIPILSLDYRKAPEYPYPYAINECYDVYHSLIATCGHCIGLSGKTEPKIIMSGDSAGGNLAVGVALMILQSGSTDSRRWHGEKVLPPPEGMILIYPALDMNIGNWMTDEQMALIRDRRSRDTNKGVLRRKSEDYRQLDPTTPHHSDDEDEARPSSPPRVNSEMVLAEAAGALTTSPKASVHPSAAHTTDTASIAAAAQKAKPGVLRTRLAMSSMISYFNDRILTPEMMRAMIILYIGPHYRPDFSTDFLLSPLLAPEQLLARFPKTYFLTGERDPLVDDTVIFAGRIRQAKLSVFHERKELGLLEPGAAFSESDHVEVVLVPGISHGFLQFVGVFPEGWKYILRCARWIRETCARVDAEEREKAELERERGDYFSSLRSRAASGAQQANGVPKVERHHFRTRTESSGEEDRPLEMTSARAVAARRTSRATRRSEAQAGEGQEDAERDGDQGAAAGYAGGDDAAGSNRTELVKLKTGASAKARRKSLVSLASEDDLLGRRMKGLTGSLMGAGGDGAPPTP